MTRRKRARLRRFYNRARRTYRQAGNGPLVGLRPILAAEGWSPKVRLFAEAWGR